MNEPIGGAVLLRVAGLPIRWLLAGGQPALFQQVRMVDRDDESRRAAGVALAERIGRELIPDPRLTSSERALLLAVRRSLHRGEPIERFRSTRWPDVPSSVLTDIRATVEWDRKMQGRVEELGRSLTTEESRLYALPDLLRSESPVAAIVLPNDAPHGHPTLKAQRHRFDHEWQRIVRATTGSTPRDWLSHVVHLPSGSDHSGPEVQADFVAHWTENICLRRQAVSKPAANWPAAADLVALNPLQWRTDQHLVSLVVDRDQTPSQVVVRHTSLLETITTALADGPKRFGELAATLPGHSDDLDTLPPFVRHLAELGIVQPNAEPTERIEQNPAINLAGARKRTHDITTTFPKGNENGWTDVYRTAVGGLTIDTTNSIERALGQALRLIRLVDPPLADNDAPSRSWTLAEIMEAELTSDEPAVPGPPKQSGGQYFDLLRELVERNEPGRPLLISADLLDARGAPADPLCWPVDALVRVPAPDSDYLAVLQQLRAPGTLDARFDEVLSTLHGPLEHVEKYRHFLSEVEEATGYLFVELLTPPLSDGAANAVRRPSYTSAWTGDPHTAAYFGRGRAPERYVPLGRIRIERVAGQLRADVGGQPIWPIYHATRTFSPPWDRIAQILLASAPFDPTIQQQRLARALGVFADRATMPRIEVDGLVLSPARWHLPADRIWDAAASLPAKIGAVNRLRDQWSLPRWVRAGRSDSEQRTILDLESLTVVRLLDRLTSTGASLTMTEVLPTPDQLHVADLAHQPGDLVASELQLRLPCGVPSPDLARQFAGQLFATGRSQW